jgi:DNA-binding transcriptional ArsR family regulator
MGTPVSFPAEPHAEQADSLSSLKAKFFNGLADGSRLAILEALRHGPHSVTELVTCTGLTQSNVSNHLACLRDCGLVTKEPRGRFAYYHLADVRIDALLQLAADVLGDTARGVESCADYIPAQAEEQTSK